MDVQSTISFQDTGNRWSGFWPYVPDMMEGMNNTFYSFRDGELYEHDAGPVNTFYGIYYPSELEVIFNDMPDHDKVWNALMQEGDEPWEVEIETNLTSSAIEKGEFNLRESRWFAYMRRDDIEIDPKSISTVGLGGIQSNVVTRLNFPSINERLGIGDRVYQKQSGEFVELGRVETIAVDHVIVETLEHVPATGGFCFAVKPGRNEGSRMRGYFMKVRLRSRATEEKELFAVNVKYDKSFV